MWFIVNEIVYKDFLLISTFSRFLYFSDLIDFWRITFYDNRCDSISFTLLTLLFSIVFIVLFYRDKFFEIVKIAYEMMIKTGARLWIIIYFFQLYIFQLFISNGKF